MAGIDVGENFLDIATLAPADNRLSLARVDLREIASPPAQGPPPSRIDPNAITLLRSMLVNVVPELPGALVLVDSPRWPRDLDWSKPDSEGLIRQNTQTKLRRWHKLPPVNRRCPPGREIDRRLRAMVAALRALDGNSRLIPISMFPTPPISYFGAHLKSPCCKPHLRILGQTLFGDRLNRHFGPPSGGIFTRFMIAGFATYRALENVNAELYESYPDLQFRLWCGGQIISSKNSPHGRRDALASRACVLSTLARKLGIRRFPQIQRMDEADASILALSIEAARRDGALWIVQNEPEGSFIVGLDPLRAQQLQSALRADGRPTDVDAQDDLLEE